MNDYHLKLRFQFADETNKTASEHPEEYIKWLEKKIEEAVRIVIRDYPRI